MLRFVLVLCLFVGSALSKVDKTRDPMVVGSTVVDSVVDMISESCVFSDDALFLRRMAYVASMDGRDTHTFKRKGTHYYGGIWQVDQDIFKETLKAIKLFADIESNFGIKWSEVQWSDMEKPLYSGLAARIAIEQETKNIPRSIEEQAVIWADSHQTISTNIEAMNKKFIDLADSLPSHCEVPRADLVFVLDASSSIEIGNFILMKEFVASVVESFSISSFGVRVAVVTYSSNAKIEFDLEEYDEKDELLQAIRDTHYLTGSTNSADALRTMKGVFADQGRGTLGVPEIGIFMTDGQSQDTAGTAQAADEVHAEQLTVFAVGITDNVNKQEVERIGTNPDCVHVYYLTTFKDVAHFSEQIERQACKAPAELIPGEEVFDDVLLGGAYHFKTKVSREEGATVMVEMQEGACEVFLSYDVRNPNDVVHDSSFVATSAEGVCGLYVPHPSESACTGTIGGNECEGKKRRKRDDGDDDVAELYGTVTGLNPGMKNWYKLKVVEGWENLNSAPRSMVNAGAVLAAFFAALMQKL